MANPHIPWGIRCAFVQLAQPAAITVTDPGGARTPRNDNPTRLHQHYWLRRATGIRALEQPWTVGGNSLTITTRNAVYSFADGSSSPSSDKTFDPSPTATNIAAIAFGFTSHHEAPCCGACLMHTSLTSAFAT